MTLSKIKHPYSQKPLTTIRKTSLNENCINQFEDIPSSFLCITIPYHAILEKKDSLKSYFSILLCNFLLLNTFNWQVRVVNPRTAGCSLDIRLMAPNSLYNNICNDLSCHGYEMGSVKNESKDYFNFCNKHSMILAVKSLR